MLMIAPDMLPFPASLTFPDVDPDVLEAEDDNEMDMLTQQGPWQSYMRRMLDADACR